jgi:hypothetical protein
VPGWQPTDRGDGFGECGEGFERTTLIVEAIFLSVTVQCGSLASDIFNGIFDGIIQNIVL